ncbi:competence/damage-inducible protein A [Nitrospira sp.]|nr:competence/damage-inducible protein A [Nitrospira sp.]
MNKPRLKRVRRGRHNPDFTGLLKETLTAETIAIGSELLLGGRLDTNSLYIAEALGTLGIEVRYKSVVGDDRASIRRMVRAAAGRVGLVVLTGGLGPTLDDCTREAVADVTREALEDNRTAHRQVVGWLRSRHRKAGDVQLRQALIPRGATVLRNPAGSAPGFLMVHGSSIIVALPGVPIEAQEMFEHSVLPRLRRARKGCAPLIRRTLLTYGLPESEVEQQVMDLVPQGYGITLGTLASPLGVALSLTAVYDHVGQRRRRQSVTSNGDTPQDVVQRSLGAMRSRLGALVYGEGRETMEEVVGRSLAAKRLTLATAESCTGGLIGHRLTQVPGSSGYYDGGVVCYSNEAKVRWLGVDPDVIRIHGAVSAEVAAAMAEGIKRQSGSAIGVSVTGIAGPGGGTSTKPVGLVFVGLALHDGSTSTRRFQFHGTRDAVKLRASQAALNCVRLALVGTRDVT